tara:strand:+ start:1418 stop:1999 length:582 start_codon:yes stop_codon:yes gene_type:complete
MKNIKNNNYYIIFGLIVLFLVVLNYNNLINFFKIKEGAENKENEEKNEETAERLETKLVDEYTKFPPEGKENSTEEKFDEAFKNPKFQQKIKDLFNLHAQLFLKQNNKTYSEYLEDLKNSKYTYEQYKTLFQGTLPYLAQMGIAFKVYEDLGVNLINELNNFTIASDTDNTGNLLSTGAMPNIGNIGISMNNN